MTQSSHNYNFRGLGGKIFIIGFMGSGKTYWGKKWARQSGLAFFDLDEEIEKQEGKTIAAIFEEDGEDYFRKIEATALRAFTNNKNCLISCGGGTACFNNNMQWMNEHGATLYLFATPQYIFIQKLF